MKYVVAIIVAIIAFPIVMFLLNLLFAMAVGLLFTVLRLAITVGIVVLLAGLVLRLMNGSIRY
jgi:hypothetical protein